MVSFLPFPTTNVEDQSQERSNHNEGQRGAEIIAHSKEYIQHPVVSIPKHLDCFCRPIRLAHLFRSQLSSLHPFCRTKNIGEVGCLWMLFRLLPSNFYQPCDKLKLLGLKPITKWLRYRLFPQWKEARNSSEQKTFNKSKQLFEMDSNVWSSLKVLQMEDINQKNNKQKKFQ